MAAFPQSIGCQRAPSLGRHVALPGLVCKVRFRAPVLLGSGRVLRSELELAPGFGLELELEFIQFHMAQKPVLRGEVGARVRVIRACGQRRERR